MAYHRQHPPRHTQSQEMQLEALNPGFQDGIEPYTPEHESRGFDIPPVTRTHSFHDEDAWTRQLPSRQKVSASSMRHGRQTLGRHARRRKTQKRPGYATMRLRHGEYINPDDIADNMMSDPDFVDSPEGLRNDEIKELATTLANKRSIKHRVDKTDSMRPDKPVGCLKSLQYRIALAWKRFKENIAEVMYSIELWRGHMKKIEGQFGSGVLSYFVFLKWLFLLNIPVFFLSFCLVVLPQILYRWFQQDPSGFVDNEKFTGLELLTGSGWFKKTELYYGYYFNGTISFLSGLKFEMPYAYLFTSLAYYIVTLIILASSLTGSYKKNFIEGRGANNFYYVTKVLSGWDFSIADSRAAELKHNGIFKELQEYLVQFRKDEEHRTCGEWMAVFLRRAAINILVLGFLGGSGYLVYYITSTQSLETDLAFLREMAMPLCISAINLVLPFAFSILGSFERYTNPRVELYLTMLRTITLNVVTLAVLVYFWYSDVNCIEVSAADRTAASGTRECIQCWEEFMGTQIYRLVIVDFIVILLLSFCSEFIRRLMAQFCCKSLGYPEFNIGRNLLYLIYSQSLVWLGTYYSPLLSLIAIIKFPVIFYVKRFSVMQNCRPSSKAWRGGRTNTFILGLLFLAYILCFLGVGYGIIFIKPSETCGPYQGQNSTFEVITDLFSDWEGSAAVIGDILTFMTSTAFIIGILTALCVAVYYTRVVAKGLDEMVDLLKHQIHLEGKDKAFLLTLLRAASNQGGGGPPPRVNGRYAPGKAGRTSAQRPREISDSAQQSPHRVTQQSPRHSAQQSPHPGSPNRDLAMRESYNQGYLDSSLDQDNPQAISMNPGFVANPMNPGYADHSPMNSRPHLPYPGTHYDLRYPQGRDF